MKTRSGRKMICRGETMEWTLDGICRKTRGHAFEPVHPQAPSSAVLIPLLETEEGLAVLYEVRNSTIPQGRDVSFPGGQMEAGESPEETAARETCEELLLTPSDVEVIAPMHRTRSPYGGILYSCLGRLRRMPDEVQRGEVERIFTVPLSWLMQTVPQRYDTVLTTVPGEDFPYGEVQNGRNYDWGKVHRPVYFYRTGKETIWGITAELTYAFTRYLEREMTENSSAEGGRHR